MHAVWWKLADPGQPISCSRSLLKCLDADDKGDQSCLNASIDLTGRKNR